MSEAVLNAICERFADGVIDSHSQCGDETAILDRSIVADVARFLKTDPEMAFDMPVDVTAVDYLTFPGHTGPRFMAVYHLYSTTKKHRIRLKVPLEADDPTTPSLTPVWKGCDWFEREAYDMYGVVFEGHPDLRRILLYPEFVGYPLRKDYPLRGYQPLVPIARLDAEDEDPKLLDIDLNPDPPASALGISEDVA